MNRLPASLALCTATVVALTACGSGTPAASGSSPAASGSTPTAPASAASTPPRQLVDLPAPTVRVGLFIVTFATPLPADPAKAQVIEGFREDVILWDQATYSWHLGPALAGHVTGNALAHLAVAVLFDKMHHAVPAGPDRYYLTTVSSLRGSRATVTTCEGGGPAQMDNRSTGKIIRALSDVPGHIYYLLEKWNMRKLNGHWAMTSFSLVAPPDPRTGRCLTSLPSPPG